MKTIWIWNHYATEMFFQQGGRHHWFAKYLIRKGYKVKIFCAATQHGGEEDIALNGHLYKEDDLQGIGYVFVKASKYSGNGMQRIKNMTSFYHNVKKAAKQLASRDGNPDIVLASSVHPLTLVAGIQFCKKIKIPCICEVRDLWPYSIVCYSNKLKNSSLIIKLLYGIEKWSYINASSLIFTMEGGKDYIIDKKWDEDSGGKIDLDKIYYINNGFDSNEFYYNMQRSIAPDPDLDSEDIFKVIYTGSIRKVNNLKILLEVAKILKASNQNNIKILIFGDGNEREALNEEANNLGLDNIIFKGHVPKKYIPAILARGSISLLHGDHKIERLTKYGVSPNKLFDYFAAGRPILSDIIIPEKYDLIHLTKSGMTTKVHSAEEICKGILYFASLDAEEYKKYCSNSLAAAKAYDFAYLTDVLEKILKDIYDAFFNKEEQYL